MSAPVRVMQLITELRPGGAERIVYELAKGIPAERYALEVCSLEPAEGAVADWLREAGVPVHSLGMRSKLDLGAPGRLRRLLHERKPAILHTHLVHANILGRWAGHQAGVPKILGTVHIPERRFRPWHFWGERATLEPGDLVVCVSSAVRRFVIARGMPAAQLLVIPNGIDVARFEADDVAFRRRDAREGLRVALNVPQEARIALAVGRLEAQKDYPHLLNAWQHVIHGTEASAPLAHLVIAGEGSLRGRLERRLARGALAGRVHLLGHREDIPELMAGADVFVQASAYEGFGLAVAEAMAARLPVVATGVDAIPEVLGDDGAGVVVPTRDPAAFGAALSKVLSLESAERLRMGEIGRARVKSSFSIERMLAEYDALYGELSRTAE